MRYLIIDAGLSGTGIRDQYAGGYIKPEELFLSPETIEKLNDWRMRYEDEHFNGYGDSKLIEQLDNEGREIALIIKEELSKIKIEYFSDALMKKEII